MAGSGKGSQVVITGSKIMPSIKFEAAQAKEAAPEGTRNSLCSAESPKCVSCALH
jgi:hypothetical protein